VTIAAALFGVVAAPALAQNSESSPAAAAPMKSKPKTPADGTITLKVTNWRAADLLELQVVASGSANWKKVLGSLKAGQWTWAKVPQPKNCQVDVRGNTPMVSQRMCPMSISARTRQSTWSTDARETAPTRSDARPSRWSPSRSQSTRGGGVLAIASNTAFAVRIIPGPRPQLGVAAPPVGVLDADRPPMRRWLLKSKRVRPRFWP
jgi:hypothetical protein